MGVGAGICRGPWLASNSSRLIDPRIFGAGRITLTTLALRRDRLFVGVPAFWPTETEVRNSDNTAQSKPVRMDEAAINLRSVDMM